MEKHSAVFFFYGALMRQWCRRKLIEGYLPTIPYLKDMYQIQSSFFILSRAALPVVEKWYDDMIHHPEYVIDASEAEKRMEYPGFIESRHDQSVLSCSAFAYWKSLNLYITRQRSERYRRGGQAVFNARISNTMMRNSPTYESWLRLIIRKTMVDPYRKLKMILYKQSIKTV